MHASNFASFINSTHNFDMDDHYEIIFHNAALTNILDKISLEELQSFLDKPVFVNTELEQPISLLAVAQERFSEHILSQVHKMQHKVNSSRNQASSKNQDE